MYLLVFIHWSILYTCYIGTHNLIHVFTFSLLDNTYSSQGSTSAVSTKTLPLPCSSTSWTVLWLLPQVRYSKLEIISLNTPCPCVLLPLILLPFHATEMEQDFLWTFLCIYCTWHLRHLVSCTHTYTCRYTPEELLHMPLNTAMTLPEKVLSKYTFCSVHVYTCGVYIF